jgi:hypothetical protein
MEKQSSSTLKVVSIYGPIHLTLSDNINKWLGCHNVIILEMHFTTMVLKSIGDTEYCCFIIYQ